MLNTKSLSLASLIALISVSITAEFSYAETGLDAVAESTIDNDATLDNSSVQSIVDSSAEPDATQNNTSANASIMDTEIAESDTPLIKDVFLVLDNSGSMKQNDPGFLVSAAVKEFIRLQDDNTRVGIIIFDEKIEVAVPLTIASIQNRELILNSIEKINYKGLFTNSPAGVERALYELKNNGREDAEKSIIFMTDGIVDTGVPDKDIEKAKWLREDLAPDAADNKIRIFGIAFTEEADFQLIQSIAQKTKGEYFRALKAEDLQGILNRINETINMPPVTEPEPVKVETRIVEVQVPAPVTEPAPAPVIIEVPAKGMDQEERIQSIIILAAVIVLIITLLAILILLLKRHRENKAGDYAGTQEAYINDLMGKTDQATYKIGKKPTMFGRVSGKDTHHLDYIVVNESTIGRRHALIEFKDYSFWIIDQGSINGTFVNDEPVKAEVRLKHGDRIRLHKCEFEFLIPDMEDSGKTVVSNTVFAASGGVMSDDGDEATQMREHVNNGLSDEEITQAADGEMDFDITGSGDDPVDDDDDYNSDDEDTIIREFQDDNSPAEIESISGFDRDDSPDIDLGSDEYAGDETIILDKSDDDPFSDEDDATLRGND